ncbi:MAG: methyltransferase domain-containing protein [Labilithrix sp.]|nr:methyltransferase domain-containing protein [Labilithrix sp.]
MSDGPKLAPPDAPPLDDIILGDDDQTAPVASASAKRGSRPSVPDGESIPPDRPSRSARDRSSNRVKAADPAKESKKRSKMTLRIPDDEVSRPQLPSTTPIGGIPSLAHASNAGSQPPSPPRPIHDDEATIVMPVKPRPGSIPPPDAGADVSLGSADDTLELPRVRSEPPPRRPSAAPPPPGALGIDRSSEPGWTPYQPPVTDKDLAEPSPVARDVEPRVAAADPRDNRTILDPRERAGDETPSVPPLSEEIPIDTDEEELLLTRDLIDDAAVTNPRLPVALDSEEIKIEDGERHTDPGEVPEVAPEDLVSVESIPQPHHPPPPRKPSATATSLMAGVSPPANAAQPVMQAPLAMPAAAAPTGTPIMGVPIVKVGSIPPTPAPPPVQQAPPPAYAPVAAAAPPPAPAPSNPAVAAPAAPAAPAPQRPAPPVDAHAPMARRPQPVGGPFGFMPPVGALAPPPMNESAANRKKTRPWWEDLFNDDFIRTMAKITDGDIAREVNFIEESLGCEAGATILDLACGTGRHAVELAARGYQVVGFDLSLAMLARASDEAQDRKQKINFVQGDMREMTFEETFDGIFSWNTSFGFFDEEKNAGVIAKVHRALKKGGQFLLDVVNRDYIIRQAPSLAWFEGDGCICMDEMQIDFITSRMKVKRTLMMDDGRTKEIEYSVRVYALHELGKMLHDNGFRVAEVSGRTGTPGVFFGCESPRTLILAEKR